MEASPEVAEALVSWFQSFDNISRSCDSIEDLSDGVVCYEVLSRIAPVYFDIDMADDGNINMLLSDLEAYYADGLGQSVDRVAELDADKLSKDKDHGQLQRLAELVLGAATLCEDNAEYVRTIMEMPADHQRCLAPIIEQAMAAAHGHGEDDRIGRSDSFHSTMSDDDMDGKSHGSGGRGRSASGVSDGAADRRVLTLEIENQRLQDEKAELQARVDELVAEAQGASAEDTATALDREQRAREREEQRVLQLMEELQDKDAELSKLRRSSAAKMQQLESKLRARADEMDVMKGRLNELSQSDAALQKAKARLEAASELKRTNKELETTNRQYLAKIMGFEEAVKAAEARASSYREQLMEAQSAKLESDRRLGEATSEVAKLQAMVEHEVEQRKFAEQQLNAAGQPTADDDGSDNDSDDGGMVERVTPALRERIARLEIENERAKSAAADAAALKEQVASLQQELASAKESLASSTAANAELEAAKVTPEASAEQVAELASLRDAVDAAQAKLTEAEAEAARYRETSSSNEAALKAKLEEAAATEARLREEKREMMNRVRSVLANFKSDKAKREKEVAALKEQASTAQKREQRHVDALKTMKKRWENCEKMLAVAERQMKAQAKEDGIMASAFYSLGLVGLSDDALDAPRAWLGNTRHLRRAARSPM